MNFSAARNYAPAPDKLFVKAGVMSDTVFVEFKFWALIIFSIVLPACIYWRLLVARAISRFTVLLFGVVLVALSAIDVYLLQRLGTEAKLSSSLFDNSVFDSEVSLALYLLPALLAGIGINLVSHVLVGHLVEAERKIDRRTPDA